MPPKNKQPTQTELLSEILKELKSINKQLSQEEPSAPNRAASFWRKVKETN